MFANYTLAAEIARQRQHDLLARSAHRHWFRRVPMEAVAPVAAHAAACSVIELPAHRESTAADTLVA